MAKTSRRRTTAGKPSVTGVHGRWPMADPSADLRLLGSRSKFWALANDDESEDSDLESPMPLTPDLVRHAAVHGFTKENLIEAEKVLEDSAGWRSVLASLRRHRRIVRSY